MLTLLEFLIEHAEYAPLRRVFEYFYRIRCNADLAGYAFLLLGTFFVMYLLMFRARIYFAAEEDKQKKRKGKKHYVKTKKEPEKGAFLSFLRWMYLYSNKTFLRFCNVHPKSGRLLFVYNAVTATVYLLGTALLVLSLFFAGIRWLFFDLVFLHLYLNIFPFLIVEFLLFLWRKGA